MRAPFLLLASGVALALACGSSDDNSASVPDGGDDSTSGGDAGNDGSNDATNDTSHDSGAHDAGPDTSGNDSGGNESGGNDSGGGDSGAGDSGAQDASDGSSSQDAADASPCGVCASGFTCGSGGYCVSSTGVPQFGHAFVIVMENHSLSSILGSSSAPYINGLMTSYAYATNYTTSDHPSLPNYIEMTSGDTQGIGCDCAPGGSANCTFLNCNLFLSNCNCPQSVSHLGDQLDALSIEWREYAESMGSSCSTSGQTHFAAKHVPFLYYTNVLTNSTRCQNRVRDYTDLATDLTSGTYRFSYISPNLCDDMHDDCNTGDPIKQGDDWLKTEVPKILATSGFKSGGHDALFIVWDEQDFSQGSAPIDLIVVSPIGKTGATTNAAYTHYSLLATIEDGFGAPRLGKASSATPINDVWK